MWLGTIAGRPTVETIPSPENTLTDQATATAERPATPYERLGGHETLRAIVDRFYDLMDEDPGYAELRALHAADLAPMRDSLTGFLAGWSGGPRDWFAGGKCVMSAHKPVAVTAETAGQWMAAMTRAIDAVVAGRDPALAQEMVRVLDLMAKGMVR